MKPAHLAIGVMFVASCGQGEGKETVYRVHGADQVAAVTLRTGAGMVTGDYLLPLTVKTRLSEGATPFISAEVQGRSPNLSCEITVEDRVVVQRQSASPRGIVSCAPAP